MMLNQMDIGIIPGKGNLPAYSTSPQHEYRDDLCGLNNHATKLTFSQNE